MNVQTMKPKTAKTAQDTTLSPRAITAYANGMAAPGTYRAGTTRGWVREKKWIKCFRTSSVILVIRDALA